MQNELLQPLLQQLQNEAEASRNNPDYQNLVIKLETAASGAVQKLMSQQG